MSEGLIFRVTWGQIGLIGLHASIHLFLCVCMLCMLNLEEGECGVREMWNLKGSEFSTFMQKHIVFFYRLFKGKLGFLDTYGGPSIRNTFLDLFFSKHIKNKNNI